MLIAIIPGATVKWYGVGQSIGNNSTGVNIDGTKSLYAYNIKIKGVAAGTFLYFYGP